jgi:hypothetical protein
MGLHKCCAHSCNSKSNFKVSCSFFRREKSGEVIRLIKASRRANEAPPSESAFPNPEDAYGHQTPFVQVAMQVA